MVSSLLSTQERRKPTAIQYRTASTRNNNDNNDDVIPNHQSDYSTSQQQRRQSTPHQDFLIFLIFLFLLQVSFVTGFSVSPNKASHSRVLKMLAQYQRISSSGSRSVQYWIHSKTRVYPRSKSSKVRPSALRCFSTQTSAESTGLEDGLSQPPTYETLPNIPYPQFNFQIKAQDSNTKARVGLLTTPHGSLETPNFIFCGTKAAMKSVTMQQMIEEKTQIILANTFHLMLTPGAEMVARMGGLHKMTGWLGPMLTDSGGYQIFSMGHGSVSNEIKGRRGAHKATAVASNNEETVESVDKTQGTKDGSSDISATSLALSAPSTSSSAPDSRTLLSITEDGAVFRSFVDGMIHNLTPERSIQIQRQLGADMIVVFDECTPFNVDKSYTEASMHRSHRWAIRCLQEFVRTATTAPAPHGLPQALYGIVQGGIYEDLRIQSTDFVNQQPFFGVAIGGSLGATKQDMHTIVEFTRKRLRDDRPIHLLGIGGIRDIFHGVRQGIDTFDCVHPTRLGRHGGALVLAKHWEEDQKTDDSVTTTTNANVSVWKQSVPEIVRRAYELKAKKVIVNERNRIQSLTQRLLTLQQELRSLQFVASNTQTIDSNSIRNSKKVIEELEKKIHTIQEQVNHSTHRIQAIEQGDYSTIHIKGYSTHFKIPTGVSASNQTNKSQNKNKLKVREHINVMKSSMRDDHRPIDDTCGCYTCRHHTRAYLHHLYKAKESLGGILVTIHNVHFMNRMMKDIREGIRTGTLDEVERKYVHPDLKDSLHSSDGLSLGE